MIKLKLQGAVAIVTIDRPQRRNALGSALMAQLGAALAEAEHNADVRSIVLTGTSPAFCAGSDLKELAGLSIAEMCHHEAVTAAFARAMGYRRSRSLPRWRAMRSAVGLFSPHRATSS